MTKKLLEFNVNDYIYVKLTEKGYQIWHKSMERYSDTTLEEYKARADADGYVAFQAWCFMNMFGEHMNMGFQTVCETNIKFEVNLDLKPLFSLDTTKPEHSKAYLYTEPSTI